MSTTTHISNSDSKNKGNKKRTTRSCSVTSNNAASTANPVPIFLRKTFELVNTTDPSVASWSKDGLTFIVKDTEKFEQEFIPKFFKHNNFSSFVRQLNFYGFHKIRSDPVRLNERDAQEMKYWRFHHENFRRGKPNLLAHIKKATNQTEAAEKKEVDELKDEIGILRGDLVETSKELDGLKALMCRTVKEQSNDEPPLKRQKDTDVAPSVPINPDSSMSHEISAVADPLAAIVPCDEDSERGLSPSPMPALAPSGDPATFTSGSMEGNSTSASDDVALLDSLFDTEQEKAFDSKHMFPVSSAPSASSK